MDDKRNKDKVVVSVVVPVYNQEKYLKDTINSILHQKCNFRYEVIIVDDCSQDNSYDECLTIANEHSDLVRLYKNEKNLGILGNIFKALYPKCQGEYVAGCAGDDIWLDENKLQKQVDYFQEHEDCSCIHTGYIREYVGANRKEIRNTWNSPLLDGYGKEMAIEVIKENFTSFPVGSSLMFKKQVLEKYARFIDDALKDPFARGEAMILFPIFALSGRYFYLSEPMVSYRVREISASHFIDESVKEKFELHYLFQKLNTVRLLKLGTRIKMYLNLKTVKYFLFYAKKATKSSLIDYLRQYNNSETYNLYPGVYTIIKIGLSLKKQ